MKKIYFLITVLLFTALSGAVQPKSITFVSQDGLSITADLYLVHEDMSIPFIVLFHQAGWSRGEYQEIAPVLIELGFNCMAVDLRSGNEVNGVKNETAADALKAGKGTSYADALQDIISALQYARKYGNGKIIAWGSSYSAALVLKIAGDYPEMVDAVLAFAPGEYFEKQGKSKTWIQDSAQKITCPVFITSAKDEEPNWISIFNKIGTKEKTSYLPKTDGNHGSRALWKKFSDSEGYWKAVKAFLEPFTVEKK